MRQRANSRRLDAGQRGGDFRGEGYALPLEPVHSVGLRFHAPAFDEAVAEHDLQKRQQEVGVAVGNDAKPFELGRGLGLARIDDNDPSTALDDVVHAVLDARRGQEAAMRDNGICAHHHQQVRPHQIRYRHGHGPAVEELACGQPVAGVLRRSGEVVGVPSDPFDEAHGREQVRVAERGRVAHVPAECTGAVAAVDLGQPCRDVGHRLVPGHRLEPVRSAPQRGGDAVGIVDDLGERDALLAGEARGQRMVLVGAQRDQTPVVDRRDHAAQRLADPAERRPLLDHRCHPSHHTVIITVGSYSALQPDPDQRPKEGCADVQFVHPLTTQADVRRQRAGRQRRVAQYLSGGTNTIKAIPAGQCHPYVTARVARVQLLTPVLRNRGMSFRGDYMM